MRFNCKHVAALLIASLKKTPAPQPKGISLEVVKWLENFRAQRLSALPDGKKVASKPTHQLAYVLSWSRSYQRCEMRLFKARCSTDGTIRAIGQSWSNVDAALVNPPKFVTAEDLFILRELWLKRSPEDYGSYGSFVLRGTSGADTLQKMILTGRLYTTQATHRAIAPKHLALSQGEVRPGQIQWQPQSDDRLQPALWIEPPVTMLLDFAVVTFDYDGVSVEAKSNTTLLPSAHGDTVQIRRHSVAEKQRRLEPQ